MKLMLIKACQHPLITLINTISMRDRAVINFSVTTHNAGEV